MHKALREVLGAHVQQKGSQVTPERTRFDFAHGGGLTAEQITEVERIVNAEVLANAATDAAVMDIESAQKSGALMLFGEKYGAEVRVLSIGSSKELCGGTHVQRAGDIGLFKIVAEGAVASGIRRVEAVTGHNALAYLQTLEGRLGHIASSLKVAPADAAQRVESLLDQIKQLDKELAQAKGKLAASQSDALLGQAVDVAGIRVLAATLEGADSKSLREALDKLRDKLKTAAIVLAAVDGDKVSLGAAVTADLTAKLKAGELVNFVAQQVGGKGGGKADMAMAGGTQPAGLPAALASVQAWVAERA
jgi:alanyl-tRNA synthetase